MRVRHVRRDDTVRVIAGRHKGQEGRVLRVDRGRGLVIVEGVNRKRRHVRPSQQNPQGGAIDKEQPIHVSNVLPVHEGEPRRIGFAWQEDGSKTRVAAQDRTTIGPPLKKPQ
jgi:large subunit ribosomal protein L24